MVKDFRTGLFFGHQQGQWKSKVFQNELHCIFSSPFVQVPPTRTEQRRTTSPSSARPSNLLPLGEDLGASGGEGSA